MSNDWKLMELYIPKVLFDEIRNDASELRVLIDSNQTVKAQELAIKMSLQLQQAIDYLRVNFS